MKRILLDNNIPYRFKRCLADLDVTHVQDIQLDHVLDGLLLDAIEGRFDVLVTMDSSLPHQQNLSKRGFCVIVLRAKSNRLHDVSQLVQALRQQIASCAPAIAYEIRG